MHRDILERSAYTWRELNMRIYMSPQHLSNIFLSRKCWTKRLYRLNGASVARSCSQQPATKTSEVSTPFYMERLDFRKDGCSSQSSPAKGTIGAALSGPLSALTLWGVSGIVRVEEVDSLTAVSTTWWPCGGYTKSLRTIYLTVIPIQNR